MTLTCGNVRRVGAPVSYTGARREDGPDGCVNTRNPALTDCSTSTDPKEPPAVPHCTHTRRRWATPAAKTTGAS